MAAAVRSLHRPGEAGAVQAYTRSAPPTTMSWRRSGAPSARDGRGVVATASYGTREIVRHEETGLLVEAHEPGAVADALERLLTQPVVRERMRAAARASAHEFSVPAVVAEFRQALARVAPGEAR